MTLFKKMVFLFTIAFVLTANAQSYRDLHGYVTNIQGAPLCSAVVVLVGLGTYIYTLADNNGYYTFGDGGDTVVEISHNISTPSMNHLQIINGGISFSLQHDENVRIDLYNLNGRMVSNTINRKLRSGSHHFPLIDGKQAHKVYVVRASFGTQVTTFKYIPFTSTSTYNLQPEMKPAVLGNSTQLGVLRVSSPGYWTNIHVIPAFTQIDFSLDTLISNIGTHVLLDGCMDRMTIWGVTKYYWGDIGMGTDVPLVKIIHARSHRVVDAAIIFNPAFVDLTYGDNSLGWNPNRPHTFNDLVKSDHVEFSFLDTDSTTIFHAKLDLLTETTDTNASSGYASLGVSGGDGSVIVGSASDVYSWGTSFDDNLNYYGYELFTNSPATDTNFTPDPQYPNWEYYAVYHICIKSMIFEPKDFGDVFMAFVHASPSKNGPDTVPVTHRIDIGQNDPFIHVQTFTVPDIQ